MNFFLKSLVVALVLTWILTFLPFISASGLNARLTCSQSDLSYTEKAKNVYIPIFYTLMFMVAIGVAQHTSRYLSRKFNIVLIVIAFAMFYLYNIFLSSHTGKYVCPEDTKSAAIGSSVFTASSLIPILIMSFYIHKKSKLA